MRKANLEVVTALLNGRTLSKGSRQVTAGGDVYLHGNKVMEVYEDLDPGTISMVRVSLAGWNTPTTRVMVNEVLRGLKLDGGFHQKDFQPYFNGQPVDATDWITVSAK